MGGGGGETAWGMLSASSFTKGFLKNGKAQQIYNRAPYKIGHYIYNMCNAWSLGLVLRRTKTTHNTGHWLF